MRQIIHNYKLRLTNLSQSNRTLKLGRLSKRRDIDLKDLGFLVKDSAEEMLERLIAGKDITLIKQADPRHEATNVADRRLNHIFRTARSIREERGTYDLFLGYPFVEGKFLDGSIVRCPVLLFPVRLERNLNQNPKWELKQVKGEPVEFNKTFLLAYEQFQDTLLPTDIWEDEIEPNKDWRAWVNALYHKIKDHELGVNFNSRLFDLTLDQFPNYLQSQMNAFALGKLIFQPHAVLGIFPQSDSALLQDYERIEQDSEAFELDTLFQPTKAPFEQKTKSTFIRHEDRYFVTPVDESQEAALMAVKQGKSIVVHGPPGTGKSQVIVNLIADAMAHNKKVLLVSQKRAALDVVFKRLSVLGLSRFAVLVHDYRHDRKAIFRKIKQLIDDLDVFQREINDINITKWELDFNLLSRQADQFHRQFTELFEALTTRNENGFSVHDLYQLSDRSIEVLSLGEMARQWDQAHLEQFCQKLAAIHDYRDFFEKNYPWKERLSFRHYAYEEKGRILDLLKEAEKELGQLAKHYQELAPHFGPDILKIEDNRDHLRQYHKIQNHLKQAALRNDIEAMKLDGLTPSKLKKKFKQLESILGKMDGLYLLADFPWRLYSNLDEHIQNYASKAGMGSRFFSIPYLRARWFLGKILQAKQKNFKDFDQLYKEYQLFQRLHHFYAKTHEKSFFEDFPLMDDLQSKHAWLEQKELHLKAFEEIQAVKVFPQLKPKFTFGKLDEVDWETSQSRLNDLHKFTTFLEKAHRNWNRFLHPQQIVQLDAGIPVLKQGQAYLAALESSLERDYEELQQVDRILASCSPLELEAIGLMEEDFDRKDAGALQDQVRQSIYAYWIENCEQESPVLREVSNRGWPRTAKTFAQKIEESRKMVTELILRKLKEKIIGIIEYNRLRNPVTYREIYHQVSKKRRLWPVRKLIDAHWNKGLNSLVPCWMASPESAAAIFPMESNLFDLVIFDEASQCFVERGLPVLLRGKQAVVAGDDQQLQPSNLYAIRYEERESAYGESELALEVESILDLAKSSFLATRLDWHYRSQQEALINFSNHAFYDGKLQVMPVVRQNSDFQPPLEWVQVLGNWQQNQNRPEAERVIEIILEWAEKAPQLSIGVVTFNYHQQELIKDLLDETIERLARENNTLLGKLQAVMQQHDDEEYTGLFVKNIENVQGDERDIIIFSIGYAYNQEGKLLAQFGLLNQEGGANRLNVAITRAKQKIYVVCSFRPANLQVDHVQNNGPKLLKRYLQYVKATSEQRPSDAALLLGAEEDAIIYQNPTNQIADYIEDALSQRGYSLVRNLGDTRYKLDIAVHTPGKETEFLLGIECEGSNYFSGPDANAREIYRPRALLDKGWKIYRVWARNFWKDREKELEKIIELIENNA